MDAPSTQSRCPGRRLTCALPPCPAIDCSRWLASRKCDPPYATILCGARPSISHLSFHNAPIEPCKMSFALQSELRNYHPPKPEHETSIAPPCGDRSSGQRSARRPDFRERLFFFEPASMRTILGENSPMASTRSAWAAITPSTSL